MAVVIFLAKAWSARLDVDPGDSIKTTFVQQNAKSNTSEKNRSKFIRYYNKNLINNIYDKLTLSIQITRLRALSSWHQ
jgi:hypothetical protein